MRLPHKEAQYQVTFTFIFLSLTWAGLILGKKFTGRVIKASLTSHCHPFRFQANLSETFRCLVTVIEAWLGDRRSICDDVVMQRRHASLNSTPWVIYPNTAPAANSTEQSTTHSSYCFTAANWPTRCHCVALLLQLNTIVITRRRSAFLNYNY